MLSSSAMWLGGDRSLLGKPCLGEMLDPSVSPASSFSVYVAFCFLSPGELIYLLLSEDLKVCVSGCEMS